MPNLFKILKNSYLYVEKYMIYFFKAPDLAKIVLRSEAYNKKYYKKS